MLKYLRDKLFFDLGPTATTDLSRPLRHDCVVAIFTRHSTCRATYVECRASLITTKLKQIIKRIRKATIELKYNNTLFYSLLINRKLLTCIRSKMD